MSMGPAVAVASAWVYPALAMELVVGGVFVTRLRAQPDAISGTDAAVAAIAPADSSAIAPGGTSGADGTGSTAASGTLVDIGKASTSHQDWAWLVWGSFHGHTRLAE